jgi:hypothetical protein
MIWLREVMRPKTGSKKGPELFPAYAPSEMLRSGGRPRGGVVRSRSSLAANLLPSLPQSSLDGAPSRTPSVSPHLVPGMQPKASRFSCAIVTLLSASLALSAIASRAARQRRIDAVENGILQGSYFAWQQSGSWTARLTTSEARRIAAAREAYALHHTSITAKGHAWPPTSAMDRMLSVVEWPWGQCAALLTGKRQVTYDRFCFPAFYGWPLVMGSRSAE